MPLGYILGPVIMKSSENIIRGNHVRLQLLQILNIRGSCWHTLYKRKTANLDHDDNMQIALYSCMVVYGQSDILSISVVALDRMVFELLNPGFAVNSGL